MCEAPRRGLEWATYLGGEGHDEATGIALARDGTGDVIVAGTTRSPDFAHTRGNHAPVGATPYVAGLNSTGTALVYSTFFGGSLNHAVLDVAVDAHSRSVVVGETMSVDFPVTPGAYDTSPPFGNNGDYDGFVVKFDASASSVVFGTYLGGAHNTGGHPVRRVALDPSSNVVVAGTARG